MRTEDVQVFVRKQPFESFRITLTDGRTYDIHHPEMVMVGRSSVAIGVPAPGGSELVYDRLITVSLLHIMQIEPILRTPSGNPEGA
jgi:hypothetical protein